MQRQADDLGGGVFKKRLNKNMHRSIVQTKGGRHWIFAYLAAKKTELTSMMMRLLISRNWRSPMGA